MAVRTKRARTTPRGFYVTALKEAERVTLQEALQVEGIDQEIALLRVRLLNAIEKEPEDLALMFKGIELLARALATRFRLGKTGRQEVQEALVAAFTDLKQAMSAGDEAEEGDA